jgi:dTDP-4-amino-4,6-dideoxygalactose transaminase
VFADVDPETGNLDPAAAREALSPRTRVLAPVDYAGRPADLDAFAALAREGGLVVVEDACHALGASLGGRPIGSVSDMTVLSFHPVKSITTGEGGAVLARDPELEAKLRAFREHGVTVRHPDWRYEVTGPGLNGRLTDIQSALGLSQLAKLDGFIRKREEIAGAYARDLAGVAELALPPPAAPGECAWHLYPVRLRLERLRAGRGEVFSDLRAAGIGVQVHYIPVYWHPLYQELGYRKGLCPKAEAFSEAEISLPIDAALAEGDRRRVVETLKRLLAGYALAGGPGGARALGSR